MTLWEQLPNAKHMRAMHEHMQHFPDAWAKASRGYEWDILTDDYSRATRLVALHKRTNAWSDFTGYVQDLWNTAEWPGKQRNTVYAAATFLCAYDDLGYLFDPATPVTTVQAVVTMEPCCVLAKYALIAMGRYTPN